MFWFFSFGLSIVLACKYGVVAGDFSYGTPTCLGVILCIIIIVSLFLIFIVSDGFFLYANLLAKKEEIKSLENHIDDIRDAKSEVVKDGQLISGSVENLQHSTALASYIKDIAKQKSEFNKEIILAKTIMDMRIKKIFTRYSLCSKEILTMDLID